MWPLFLFLACVPSATQCPERMKWKEERPLDGHRAGWCEGASGARNGMFREWNEGGRLVVDGYFWRNQRSGWWRRWRDDGTLAEEVPYTSGKVHGPSRTFDESGALRIEQWHDHGEKAEGAPPSPMDAGDPTTL